MCSFYRGWHIALNMLVTICLTGRGLLERFLGKEEVYSFGMKLLLLLLLKNKRIYGILQLPEKEV